MADESTSDRRQQARSIFEEAQQAYASGRLAWAVEYAREALRVDGGYAEARVEAGAIDRASRQYQIILRSDRDDRKAWAALEAIDPEAADRVRRLHEIPPDPFVRRRRARISEEFDMMGEIGAEQEIEEGAAPFVHKEISEDFEPLDEVVPSQELREVGGISPKRRAGSSDAFEAFDELGDEEIAGGEAPGWEFTEDREYYQQWMAIEGVAELVAAIEDAWATRVVQPVVAACVPVGDDYPQLIAAAANAAQKLSADPPELYLTAERHMQPFVIQSRPTILAVPQGVCQVLSPAELTFVVGRCLGPILSGYLGPLQAVDVLLQRPINSVRQLRLNWRELITEATADIAPTQEPQVRRRLRAIGHAWQQRAELSADRAGLLACSDCEASCDAIARGTAASAQEAAERTAARLMARYEGHSVAQLAAIPTDEDPAISAEYAVYRIQMLRWWASSNGYQTAINQVNAQ